MMKISLKNELKKELHMINIDWHEVRLSGLMHHKQNGFMLVSAFKNENIRKKKLKLS